MRHLTRKDKGRRSGSTGILKRCLFLTCLFMTIASLSSCGRSDGRASLSSVSETEGSTAPRKETGFVQTSYDSFDSADTAICMKKDAEGKTVTLWNCNVGKCYTLEFDGTTSFTDKYGESISFAQLSPGDVVDVTFLKSKKHLTTLKLSPQVWSLEKVTYFDFDPVLGVATIGQDEKKWKITANTKFFSGGRTIDLETIDQTDTLSFQGIDTEVLTVKVERGHGYLRLSGQEKFIGGWLEIGQSQIQRIKEEMLLPLPEGAYRVTVSKDESGGEKTVVIHRNEETILDISDLEVAEPEKGTVLFTLSPSNAKLYVDGEKMDASLPVTLVYGIHQVMVKADNYQTVTQYIRVGQPSVGIDIALDPVDSGSEESSSSEGDRSQAADYYKIYVDAPKDVEVYLDGNYVGITPCSFQKTEGSHVIMLRKSGYQSKSYTVLVSNDDKDVTFSFADLVPTTSSSGEASSVPDLNEIVYDILGNIMN